MLCSIFLIGVIAAGIIGMRAYQNGQQYQQALDDMEAGEYEQAKRILLDLGDYKDSKQLSRTCDTMLENGQSDSDSDLDLESATEGTTKEKAQTDAASAQWKQTISISTAQNRVTTSSETTQKEDMPGAGATSLGNGTSSSNIINGGFVAAENGYRYYRGDDGMLYREDQASKATKLLLQKAIWYINVQNEWVYFSNETDGTVERIHTDGSDRQVLYQGAAHEVTVYQDWIYFGTADAVYRMHLDGSSLTKLLDGNVWYLHVTDSGLYYCRITADNRALCSCALDGSKVQTLIPSDVYAVSVFGDQIYYTSGAERYLYSISLTGANQQLVSKQYFRWIAIYNQSVFFTNEVGQGANGVGYGGALYRMDLATQETYQLADQEVEGIVIVDGVLYYMNADRTCTAMQIGS